MHTFAAHLKRELLAKVRTFPPKVYIRLHLYLLKKPQKLKATLNTEQLLGARVQYFYQVRK